MTSNITSITSKDGANGQTRKKLIDLKRIFDIAAAGTGLLCLSPFMAAAAIASAVAHKTFPLYKQRRVGKDGHLFTIFKIKSMHTRYDDEGKLLPNEDRITQVGKFLRRVRLDESLQLWNILKGDMSIVGPRPIMPGDETAFDPRRVEVKPGCTGLAQIHGLAMTGDNRLHYDHAYVALCRRKDGLDQLKMDIGIIMKTPEALIHRAHVSKSPQRQI